MKSVSSRLKCFASLPLAVLLANASPPSEDKFLEFPMVTEVSASTASGFAWLVVQGEVSTILWAQGPDFRSRRLYSRTDVDGDPITALATSPDGRFVAFQTGTALAGGDKGYNPAGLTEAPKGTVWLVRTDGQAKPEAVGTGVGPQFSPDGRRLVYRHGGSLWSLDLGQAGAKAGVLLPDARGVGSPVWASDGRSFYFVQDRGGYSFLGEYALGSDRIRWLLTAPDRLTSPVLSPDGKAIAYLRWPGRQHGKAYDQSESEPFAVGTLDLASLTVRSLWQSAAKAGLASPDDPEGDLRWSDDRNVVFRAEQDGWARLYAVSREGGPAKALTPTGCEVAESERVALDKLFVVDNCRGIDTRQVSLITVSTGKTKSLASDDVVIAAAEATGDDRYVAFTGSTAEQAPLLRILDLATGKPALRETPQDFGYSYRFNAPPPQVVTFKAADGSDMTGQLFLPSTRGPHPGLIYVHGGPMRQMFPAFHYRPYYANDYAMNRRLAELGYVVLSVNYRSGTGYGRAFREAAARGWRGASEYDDVLGAGRWLAARKDVDGGRIGIWGGSYGGLLTAQALARNSNLFRAGVAVHGVFDWSWPSSIPGHLNPSRFFGVGEADRALARASSPVGHLDGWKSPVLLMSGDQDMDVDVSETIDLTQKLREREVDVTTVLIPGEAHVMVRHTDWVKLWRETQSFFEKKLKK